MDTNGQPPKPVSPVAFFCDAALTVERARIAAQVRLSHLQAHGRTDPETEELLRRIRPVEEFVDGRLAEWVLQHPTAKWWRYEGGEYGIKGAGREAVGKVIGLVEAFGTFYPEGEAKIPPYVHRQAVPGEDGRLWVWVEGIERLTTPSKQWKYGGLNPGARRRAGEKLEFNIQLRVMSFRLMTSFMRARNHYYEEYLAYKEWKRAKLEGEGVKIVPTPRGRYCLTCQEDMAVPSTTDYCPVCGDKLARKEEPEGVMWEGHLEFMARRRAIKLFHAHLWVVWREALGLPVRTPYPVEYGGHSRVISPWEMCDKRPQQANGS